MSCVLIIAVIWRGAVTQVEMSHRKSWANTPQTPWRINESRSAWASEVGSVGLHGAGGNICTKGVKGKTCTIPAVVRKSRCLLR